MRSLIMSARPVLPDDVSRERKYLAACKIWEESAPIDASLAEVYLASLGVLPSKCSAQFLRFHPAVLHEPTRVYYPTLLAAVRDEKGFFVGIHRTYLRPEGRRWVQAEKPRMLGNCFGSFIQLASPKTFKLILAVDLEMALAVQQVCPDVPVWATMSLGNMKSTVPPTVKEIILCIEDDHEDRATAHKIILDAVREHTVRGQRILIARIPMGSRLRDILASE